MSKPKHTQGPVEMEVKANRAEDGLRFDDCYIVSNGKVLADTFFADFVLTEQDRKDNARLLAAAYNAFDSAGRILGWNAVLFAEAAQDGGIADLVDALISAERFIAKQSGGGETEFRASLLAVLRKVNPGVQA